MSYVKNTWQTGDTITATGLNHMEDGIADAGSGGGGGVSFYGPYYLIVAEDGTIAAGSTDTINLSKIVSYDDWSEEYNFPSADCCFILNAIKVGSWALKDDISIMKFDLPFYYSDSQEWDGAYLTLTNNTSDAFTNSSANMLVYTTEELTRKA